MKKNSPICHIYKTEIPETDWEKQFWILDFGLGKNKRRSWKGQPLVG
jgi:hypothetical protein